MDTDPIEIAKFKLLGDELAEKDIASRERKASRNEENEGGCPTDSKLFPVPLRDGGLIRCRYTDDHARADQDEDDGDSWVKMDLFSFEASGNGMVVFRTKIKRDWGQGPKVMVCNDDILS
jgi:hypothetical protein